ncbi:RNA-binding S4 domain-containing protein [Cellvibrio sp. PSBB006]|jgi:ribosome-associated heat shock protein Hsp15|uniref:RNA-binding S4 domain-containing protein n=1 Tax=Cellvibrio sp. PSBB006 TaxID=1987723 RepID=UPI001E587867|nr:S4 domain-containing protein [Cellvibrio sp. PSBB006]
MMTTEGKVRIDKWLWAARFFKTRNLAKQAIEGGKIHCDGHRVKASKEITTGLYLTIRQNMDEKTVLVTALSEQRRGAPEAALLYQETEESRTQREELAAQRKAGMGSYIISDHRPNKKERRQIHRFERKHMDDL